MLLLIEPLQNFFAAFNEEIFIHFFIRLFINVVSTFILIRFIYYPNNSNAEYLFAFFMMGMTIFLIASILDSVSIKFGFALGLFAVFAIIRFRTTVIGLKEMTYLFMVVGISIINAMMESSLNNATSLFVANVTILLAAIFMEWYKPKRTLIKKSLTFKPSGLHILNNNKLLLYEVQKVTSIDVFKVELIKVNASKKDIEVWIYYEMKKDNEKELQA